MSRRIHIAAVLLFVSAVIIYFLNKVDTLSHNDSNGPRINMNESTITVPVGATEGELLSGVSAYDEEDGDVTSSLIIESMSNFIEPGRRNITIVALDSSSNVAKATREVVYSGYTGPKFTLSSPLRFPKNTESVMGVLGAEDVLDGNLSENIKISSDYQVAIDTEGEYSVLFTVTNSAGDMARLPATVEIYDTQKEYSRPVIELSQYIVYVKAGTVLNPWDYVSKLIVGTAEYARDERGLLSRVSEDSFNGVRSFDESDFNISGTPDYGTKGVYEILYQISSDNNEAASVRLIVVVE